MTTKQELIILWGSKTRTITWAVRTHQDHALGTVIATAEPTGFRVHDLSVAGVVADYDTLAPRVLDAWQRIRAGEDLDHWATHELDPELNYQAYRPKAQPAPTDGQTDALGMLEAI